MEATALARWRKSCCAIEFIQSRKVSLGKESLSAVWLCERVVAQQASKSKTVRSRDKEQPNKPGLDSRFNIRERWHTAWRNYEIKRWILRCKTDKIILE